MSRTRLSESLYLVDSGVTTHVAKRMFVHALPLPSYWMDYLGIMPSVVSLLLAYLQAKLSLPHDSYGMGVLLV